MLAAYNMESRSGRKVPNQIIVKKDGVTSFVSYDSLIAEIDRNNHEINIGKDYAFSSTTGKYRNQFFNQEGFTEIDSLPALEAMMQVGCVVHNDIPYIINRPL